MLPVPAPVIPQWSLPADEKGAGRAPDSDVRVVLKQVRLTGETAAGRLTPEALQKVVAPWLNKPLSYTELQAVAAAVTQYYRAQGILLARAVLPPQTVKGGVLTVQLIPGQYDTARIRNSSPLKNRAAERIISGTLPAGNVVRKKELERAALLLSEIPGVTGQVSLIPGEKSGTTTPEITIRPGKRVAGYLGLDNQGNPTTGRSRVLGGVVVNNLSGWGDQLRLDVLDAYENRDLFNGSLDYSLPAGGKGARIGAGYSRLNYHYDFMRMGYSGYSDNWGLYAVHPWVRTSQARVDVRLDAGQQFLTDKYPSGLLGEAGKKGRKQVSLGSLGVSGSVAAVPGGVSGFSLQGTYGRADHRNEVARQIAFSREVGSSGGFFRLNWQLSHEQLVRGPFSVYARLNGQQAGQNLDSSQKLLLGGPAAVRAYDTGAGAVDNGVAGALELRGRWPVQLRYWPGKQPELIAAAFYDYGRGEQYQSNRNHAGRGQLTGHNRVALSGAGLYTTLSDRENYALTLTWAQRTGEKDPVSGQSDRNRFWLNAVKMF